MNVEKIRCRWCNPNNEIYLRYHDTEWGKPVYDDRILYEFLLLEPFQAGLSWECVLNKRKSFYEAFDHFDPELIKDYDISKVEQLLLNPDIIRNRKKIEAAITNAGIFLQIQKEFGNFSDYIWGFSKGEIVVESDKTVSPLSDAISKDLKKRGMKFIGSTTVYAYLQAVGIVNSHEPGCFLCNR